MNPELKTQTAIYEPLAESAPIAYRLAQSHCREGASKGACLTYHSIWQYLRLIGQISTIASDDDFFLSQLARLLAKDGHDRVLISASADYGMLARVIAASRVAGVRPEITLIDICPTPLHLSLWYGEQVGFSIQTTLGDIFEFTNSGAYDIICTHSFIGRMLGRREELLSKWHDLLRPGGKALTSVRIRYDIDEPIQRFSQAEAEAFAELAEARAHKTHDLVGLTPRELREHALGFALEKVNCPLPSRDHLTGLCERAGFKVELDSRGIKPVNEGRPTSPRTGSATERVRLILTRN